MLLSWFRLTDESRDEIERLLIMNQKLLTRILLCGIFITVISFSVFVSFAKVIPGSWKLETKISLVESPSWIEIQIRDDFIFQKLRTPKPEYAEEICRNLKKEDFLRAITEKAGLEEEHPEVQILFEKAEFRCRIERRFFRLKEQNQEKSKSKADFLQKDWLQPIAERMEWMINHDLGSTEWITERIHRNFMRKFLEEPNWEIHLDPRFAIYYTLSHGSEEFEEFGGTLRRIISVKEILQ